MFLFTFSTIVIFMYCLYCLSNYPLHNMFCSIYNMRIFFLFFFIFAQSLLQPEKPVSIIYKYKKKKINNQPPTTIYLHYYYKNIFCFCKVNGILFLLEYILICNTRTTKIYILPQINHILFMFAC